MAITFICAAGIRNDPQRNALGTIEGAPNNGSEVEGLETHAHRKVLTTLKAEEERIATAEARAARAESKAKAEEARRKAAEKDVQSLRKTVEQFKKNATRSKEGTAVVASAPGKPKSCGLIVMFRTHDSEDYIEEFVAYYLAQGASLVHVADSSDHPRVHKVLRPYIKRNLVYYEQFVFDKIKHGVELHGMAMRYISRYSNARDRRWWLLSVDDDEFVLPHEYYYFNFSENPDGDGWFSNGASERKRKELYHKSNSTFRLNEFLCMDEVLQYKSVRFAWRPVGTNGVKTQPKHNYGNTPGALLDIERYLGMKLLWGIRQRTGKPAFQINHPDVNETIWMEQNLNDKVLQSHKRPGGVYFLHGNNPHLGKKAVLQHGYCYHFTRAEATVLRRAKAWKNANVKTNQVKQLKDYAQIKVHTLKAWAAPVKKIIDDVRGRTPPKGGYPLVPDEKATEAKKHHNGQRDVSVKGRNLVFTSAGDHSSVLSNWTGPDANFDVFLVYYGKSAAQYESYRKQFRWVTRRRGSKIQNFYEMVYKRHKEIVDASDYILLLDDDITFEGGAEDITNLFEISRFFSLSIAMPALRNGSRISHPATRYTYRPDLILKYTNFVEISAALFSRKALKKTMELYDPKLIGWGVDYLALCANGLEKKKAYAVIHSVPAMNPSVRNVTNKRELSLLPGWNFRKRTWLGVARTNGCPKSINSRVYSEVTMEELDAEKS